MSPSPITPSHLNPSPSTPSPTTTGHTTPVPSRNATNRPVSPTTPVVDAHQHFWAAGTRPPNPRTAVLDQGFAPADLERELLAAGIERTVLVQCVAGPEENDRLAAYARDFAPVGAVVVWIPLHDAETAAREVERVLASNPLVRGVRAAVPKGTTATTELRGALAAVERSGLLWEIVVTDESHVALVEEIAAALPGLRVVADHMAAPPLATGDPGAWNERIRRLAALPSVAVKVSVGGDVLTGWEWELAPLVPCVHRVLDAFGAERSMLASNWPVIRLATDHGTAWRELSSAVGAAGASAAEAARVVGGTALDWYGMDTPGH